MGSVTLTKSGVFVRLEEGVGYLLYSPFTGLFFAAKDSKSGTMFNWLNLDSDEEPSMEFVKALGAGWYIEYSEAEYPIQHLLPTNGVWEIVTPKSPILINWFLTGVCALDCLYCYAQDLMHNRCEEPSYDDIRSIASNILSCNPLAVVLTGGDPLLSPHLKDAIEILSGKCGIIIDTSGYRFTDDHLELFKAYDVFVRVSLDSEIPRINDQARPLLNRKPGRSTSSSAESAVSAIVRCLDAGIRVGIQTVVTRLNRSDLEVLGDKLFRLGISNWRIMNVAKSKERFDQYINLRGDEKGQKRYYNHILKQLQLKHKTWWHQGMAVQLTHNRTPNAVILVSPDGMFYTESNIHGSGKELISRNGTSDLSCSIFAKVSIHAHAERYLNLSYQ